MPFFLIFRILANGFLEHFQLLSRRCRERGGMAMENLHHPKLLVGNAHNADVPFFRQDLFDPDNVDIRIFPTTAVAHVNGELEHLKTIFHDVLTEPGVYFTLRLGFRWQVKKYQYPQYSIRI